MVFVVFQPMGVGSRVDIEEIELTGVERDQGSHLPRVRPRGPDGQSPAPKVTLGGPFRLHAYQAELADVVPVLSVTEAQWLRGHVGAIDQLIVEDHGDRTH